MIKEDKIFDFKIIETYHNYSVLELNGTKYTYPVGKGKLGDTSSLNLEQLNKSSTFDHFLDVLEINKSYRITDFYLDRKDPKFCRLNVLINGFYKTIKLSKWLENDEDFVNSKVVFVKLLATTSGNKFLVPVLNYIERHYKFIKDTSYNFEIIRINPERQKLLVKDVDDNLIYNVRNHYSNIDIKTGDLIKLKYVGLNKNKQPILTKDKIDNYIPPTKLISEKEYNFLTSSHLINYQLEINLKTQIKEKDGFWILSACNYLAIISSEFISRGELENSFEASKIFKKLSGFLNKKGFFKDIPPKLKSKIEPNFENSKKFIEINLEVVEFLSLHSVDDLFKSEYNGGLELRKSILKSLFVLKYFKLENISEINNILDGIESVNSEQKQVLELFFLLFDLHLVSSIINLNSSMYFDSLKTKVQWSNDINLSGVIRIIKKSNDLELCLNSSTRLNFALLGYLGASCTKNKQSFKELVSGFFNTLNFYKYNFDEIELKELKYLENKICINKPIHLFSSNYGYFLNNNKIFIVRGTESLHYGNYLLSKGEEIELDIIDNFFDSVYHLKYNGHNIFGSIDLKVNDSVEVIYKSNNDGKSNTIFCTYYRSSDGNKDLLVLPSQAKFFHKERYNIGDPLNVRIVNFEEGKGYFGIEQNPYFHFNEDELDINYTGQVTRKKVIKNNECKNCKSPLSIYDAHSVCLECGNINFEYLEIFIPRLKKYLYVNKFSVRGIYGTSFINKSRIGDLIKFKLSSNKFQYKYKSEKYLDFNEIYPDLNSLESVSIINQKYLNNALGKNILFLFYEINLHYRSNIYKLEKFNHLVSYFSAVFKASKGYLVSGLDAYKKILKLYFKEFKLSNEIEKEIDSFKDLHEKTVQAYPKFEKIFNSLEIISVGEKNYSDLVKHVESSDSKLAKLLLARNLIRSESEDSNIIKSFNELIKKNLVDNDKTFKLSINSNLAPEDPNIYLLKQIENGEILESQAYEFKETFIYPVLDQGKIRIINNLKDKINEDPSKEESLTAKMKEIRDSVPKWSSEIASTLAYSTIKNIAAFLNSNEGKIIIGVSDNSSLTGLSPDYKKLNDWDGFQRKFEEYWNNLIDSPQLFRPFIKLNRVLFKDKEFCIIDISYPSGVQRACFVKKGKKEIPKLLIKQSSTTSEVGIVDIQDWKRKKRSIKEDPTSVYLMKNNDGLTKIGVSKDVNIRLNALKPEFPNIELIDNWVFPNKTFAHTYENRFQKEFQNKNVIIGSYREWFDLSDSDIEYLKKELTDLRKSIIPNEKDNIKMEF